MLTSFAFQFRKNQVSKLLIWFVLDVVSYGICEKW